MFKQITREEYLALADVGVQVSAWENEDHFEENMHYSKFMDDAKHFPKVVEEVLEGDDSWQLFYAWVDDEEDADVRPIT